MSCALTRAVRRYRYRYWCRYRYRTDFATPAWEDSAHVIQQPVDDIGSVLIGASSPMGVKFHRGGAVNVAQSRCDGRYGHASVEELGCLEVAEVV